MSVPDYQSLMLPVLSVSANGEIRVRDAIAKIGEQLNLTEEDRTQLLPSGRQGVLENRVNWAKLYLDKAGLIETTRRGHFKITERGQKLLDSRPKKIDNNELSRFDEFKKFKDRSLDSVIPDGLLLEPAAVNEIDTPDEIMRSAHKRIEVALSQDLLDRIRAAPPDFFERLIVNLLLAMGYGGSTADAGRALGRSGDGGVDGVIDQDALGLDRVYVQAKRYGNGNNIGSGAIREFFGSLDRHKAAKGLFVTTSAFSSAAKDTAELLSKRLVLIDGELLTRLMIRHNVGCRIEDTLHIRKIDEDFFE